MTSHASRKRPTAVLLLAFLLLELLFTACQPESPDSRSPDGISKSRSASGPCTDELLEPQIRPVTEGIWAATGFDLANVILVRAPHGMIVVDSAMSPARADAVRSALRPFMSGPVLALIYTHSHIDHVGGASRFVEPGTQIWATANFHEHFFKQYGLFRETEMRRGFRQFGRNVATDDLECSALGPRPDLQAAESSGSRLPTHTFRERQRLQVGGLELELIEAHGETHDQLMVWIPSAKTLLAGDNFYRAFPNLYTIRGSRPRPIDDWISSLDAMRRLEPEFLVPSHTDPLSGREVIQGALRDYRDAIQWVRDEVIRRSNRGERLESLSSSITLPPHLAQSPFLQEWYGQVDWSARAIFTNELGFFDGDPTTLYPPPDLAALEIDAMGGPTAVLARAKAALDSGKLRWAVHQLGRLAACGTACRVDSSQLDPLLAGALRKLALELDNTNGRAYLLEFVHEINSGAKSYPVPTMDDELIRRIPLRTFFDIMVTRVIPEKARDLEVAVAFRFDDEQQTFYLTVRRGVVELSVGTPLPGSPEPVAWVVASGMTWRKLALKTQGVASALLSGELKIDGDKMAFINFMALFDRS